MAQVTRILVPTDFSTASDLATDYAIEMALRYGASIRVVHVLEDMYLAGFPDGYIDIGSLRQQQEDDAARRLDALTSKCAAAHLDASSDVLTGHPAGVIVAAAVSTGADMIVMGTHGRTGVAHMILGSVAERVVRSASCPVLTVRETPRLQSAVAADAAARPEALPVAVAY